MTMCVVACLAVIALAVALIIFALALADAASLTDAPTGRPDDYEDYRDG